MGILALKKISKNQINPIYISTIMAVHPIFIDLYKKKTPQSIPKLGKDIILDGHHTLYLFFKDVNKENITINYYKKIVGEKILFDIYNFKEDRTIDFKYYNSDIEIFYAKSIQTNTIFEFIFPIIKENNGYTNFINAIKKDKQYINIIKNKVFPIYTEDGYSETYTDLVIDIVNGSIDIENNTINGTYKIIEQSIETYTEQFNNNLNNMEKIDIPINIFSIVLNNQKN